MQDQDVNVQGLGLFYKRPTEHMLGHLTDVWHNSQPPHLRHLAIVRDTKMENKGVHYLYRSYGNFAQAVANGETSWEAIGWSHDKEKTKAKDTVDKWGFPVIPAASFHAKTGAATVSEARRAQKFERQKRSFLNDYINMVPPPVREARPTQDIDAKPTPKKTKIPGNKTIGRPRKYPKGQEPYKSGNHYRKKDGVSESKVMSQARQLALAELPAADRLMLDPSKRKGRPPKTNTELSKPRKRPLKQPLLEDIVAQAEPNSRKTTSNLGQHDNGDSANGEPVIGTKRAAPNSPEREPAAKRQELDIEEYKGQLQARLNDRVQVLHQELITLSRPGLYVAPLGSNFTSALGSSLVVVAKSHRLRQLAWFTPSDDIPKLVRGANLLPAPALPRNEQAAGSLGDDIEVVDTETPKRPTKRRKTMKLAAHDTVPRAITSTASSRPFSTEAQSGTDEMLPLPMIIDAPLQSATISNGSFLDQLMAAANVDTPLMEVQAASNGAAPLGVDGPIARSTVDDTGSNVENPAVLSDIPPQERDISQMVSDQACGNILEVHDQQSTDASSLRVTEKELQSHHEQSLVPSLDNLQHASGPPGAFTKLSNIPWPQPTITSQPRFSRYTPALVKQATPRPQTRFSDTPDDDYGGLDVDASSLTHVTIGDEAEPQKPKRTYQRKVGVRLGAGGMVGHARNQRLLKLIEMAGGAYPGDRELYYAFSTDIAKVEADVTTDWPTIKRAIKQLVDSKKLIKITFVFADKNGVATKKHILLLPGTKGDSESVRRLQRCMVAAHPQYYFPEGVDINRAYSERASERRRADPPKTIIEREELVPKWAPIPSQTSVTQEPAWKQWAKAEKVGGDLVQTIREMATGTMSDEEAFAEEPDEEQLGMQAQFQLGTYTHNSEAVPQRALSKGAKYASRTSWFQKQKERGDQARFERERRERMEQEWKERERLDHLERQRQEAAKKQRDFVAHVKLQRQQLEKAKAATPSKKPDIDLSGISLQFAKDIGLLDMDIEEVERSQQQYFLETEVEGGSSGFVTTTISSTPAPLNRFSSALKPKAPQAPAAIKFQEPPIFFVQKTPVTINPNAWVWPHGKRKRGRQPINVPVQSLTDPDQKWHRMTGTFSTDFFFYRANRPALKIDVNSHREWENKIPGSLEEMIEQRRRLSTTNVERAPVDFNDQVDQVALWEKENSDLINEMSLVNPRFINFTVPEEVATPTMRRQITPESVRSYSFKEQGTNSIRRYSSIETPQSKGFKKPALPETARRKGRKPKSALPQGHTTINNEEHRRLVAGVIVLRTLLGGVEQQISWSMVEKLLPDHDGSTLQDHWRSFSRTNIFQLARFQDEFEKAFAEAYEQRLMPPINFNNLAHYDWDGVLVWTMENLQVPTEEADAQLPGERQLLENLFETQDVPLPEDHVWDEYFKELTTHIKRGEIINTATFDDAFKRAKPVVSNDPQTCARSLLRANAFAPEERYDAVAARRKIEGSFSEPEVNTALASLLSSGMLLAKNKGRPVPGRNYYVNDRYYHHIKRNALDIPALQAACSAKIHLDNAIFDPAGPGFYTVDYTTSDGEIMLILELVSQGRLSLQIDVPPTTFDPDVKCLDPTTGERHLSIWGFTVGEGHYKSTKMDRDNLTFRANAYPTDSYVPGVPLQNPLPPPPAPMVMTKDGKVRVPLWYDIHDNLLPDIWESFVVMVLAAVVLRPGCGIKYIMEKMTRKIVEEWDVELVIEWLVGLGVVKGSGEEGWRATEWWWAVFGCGPG